MQAQAANNDLSHRLGAAYLVKIHQAVHVKCAHFAVGMVQFD